MDVNKDTGTGDAIFMHSSTSEMVKGVQAYPHKDMVKTGANYISDLAVGGDSSSSAAKNVLTSNGYMVYNKDLNEKAGGYYIYIGYKTTKDINQALGSIWVEQRSFLDKSPKSNTKPSLVPVYGNQKFKNSHGDLNYDAGGAIWLYLHQEKVGELTKLQKGGISSFWINGSKPGNGEGDTNDLNEDAGGSDLYLHYQFSIDEVETGVMLENDPEYYPYSYVLGARVAIGKYRQYFTDERFDAAIKKTDGSFRNWTDDEVRAFISRMGNKTWDEELKSAGLTEISDTFSLKIKWDISPYGTVLKKGSNTISEIDYHGKPTFTFLKLYN